MDIQEILELLLVPAGENGFFVNDEGGIFSETMDKRFVDTQERFRIDKRNADLGAVKLVKLSYPSGELQKLFP